MQEGGDGEGLLFLTCWLPVANMKLVHRLCYNLGSITVVSKIEFLPSIVILTFW